MGGSELGTKLCCGPGDGIRLWAYNVNTQVMLCGSEHGTEIGVVAQSRIKFCASSQSETECCAVATVCNQILHCGPVRGTE